MKIDCQYGVGEWLGATGRIGTEPLATSWWYGTGREKFVNLLIVGSIP